MSKYMQSMTICWDCENAVPSADGGKGCPWSVNGQPVEGWKAKRQDVLVVVCGRRRKIESYMVKKFPMFKKDGAK